MKKARFLLLLISILFLCSSCNSKSEKEELSEDLFYHKENEIIEDKNSDLEDGRSKDGKSSEEGNSIDSKDPLSGNSDITFSELTLPDFPGISSSASTPSFGNLGINMKVASKLCLVCPATDCDATYYVGYGKDDYIYCLENGETSLVVEKKTNFIQYWNKEIYFISDMEVDPSSDMPPKHCIYRYNTETKEISLVLEGEICWFQVGSDGIYYVETISDNGGNGKNKGYFYDLYNNSIQELEYPYYIQYRDYILQCSDDLGIILHKMDTSEKLVMFPPEISQLVSFYEGDLFRFFENNQICIYQDYAICMELNKIHYLNLVTGERMKIELNSEYSSDIGYNNIGYSFMILSSYTILDKTLYISSGSYLYRTDLESGSVEKLTNQKFMLDSYGLKELFTDGKKIYSVVDFPETEEKSLVELVINEEGFYMKELDQ